MIGYIFAFDLLEKFKPKEKEFSRKKNLFVSFDKQAILSRKFLFYFILFYLKNEIK